MYVRIRLEGGEDGLACRTGHCGTRPKASSRVQALPDCSIFSGVDGAALAQPSRCSPGDAPLAIHAWIAPGGVFASCLNFTWPAGNMGPPERWTIGSRGRAAYASMLVDGTGVASRHADPGAQKPEAATRLKGQISSTRANRVLHGAYMASEGGKKMGIGGCEELKGHRDGGGGGLRCWRCFIVRHDSLIVPATARMMVTAFQSPWCCCVGCSVSGPSSTGMALHVCKCMQTCVHTCVHVCRRASLPIHLHHRRRQHLSYFSLLFLHIAPEIRGKYAMVTELSPPETWSDPPPLYESW